MNQAGSHIDLDELLGKAIDLDELSGKAVVLGDGLEITMILIKF